MKSRLLLTAWALANLLVISAWTPLVAQTQKGTLVFAVETLSGQTMDPILEGRPGNAVYQSPMYDSLVGYDFDKGGVGALHSHPHVQASYVAEGRFEVTIDGRSEVLEAGSSFIVPSNLVHSVKALEAGRLVDSFTPHRADFLD